MSKYLWNTTLVLPSQRTRQRIKNRIGFTLIQLLVVIVILAILSYAAVSGMLSAINGGRQSTTLSDFKTYSQDIETAVFDNPTLADNAATATSIANVINPYLDANMNFTVPSSGTTSTFTSVRKDPWGHPYTLYITNPAANGGTSHTTCLIVIKSNGANGVTAGGSTVDSDDLAYVIEVVDGAVHEASYGFGKHDTGALTAGSTNPSTAVPSTDESKWAINY